jgi:hypothetical protein
VSDLPEMLYTKDCCDICGGDGEFDDGEVCDSCGGTGFKFINLGPAVWEIALCAQQSTHQYEMMLSLPTSGRTRTQSKSERTPMSEFNLFGACIFLLAIFVAGCERPAGEASHATPNSSAADEVTVKQSTPSPAEDDAWRGLERHEIQLDQKLLIVKGSKGVIGCPYLNVGSFEKFGEALDKIR